MAQPNTLYKYFTGQGKKLPSVAERGKMFNLGAGYAGTKEQNIALLTRLLGGGGSITAQPRGPAGKITHQVISGQAGGQAPGGFVAGMPTSVTDRYGNTVNLPSFISQISKKYGISTAILSAQLKQESGFNPNAGSVAGAMGIAQFIKSTAKSYGIDPWNVKEAIEGQARLMADNLKQYGTIERALSAYNSGNPDRYNDPSFRTHYGSVGETYNYVRNINAMSKKVAPYKPEEGAQRREGINKQLRNIIEKTLQRKEPTPSGTIKPDDDRLGHGIFPMPPIRNVS